MEREILCAAKHASTTSEALADALVSAYQCPRPAVVYNAFPTLDRDTIDDKKLDRGDTSLPSLHWYSQTVGPGRGLEILFESLAFINEPIEVHIRGNCRAGYEDHLRGIAPSETRDRVFFHPPVQHDDLLARIAEHDIGFAGETSYCDSRDLTITNKILHFLLAGLAVVSSDTSGQTEVAAKCPESVVLYQQDSPQSLAKAIHELIRGDIDLPQRKSNAWNDATTHFAWEDSADVLLESVKAAVKA